MTRNCGTSSAKHVGMYLKHELQERGLTQAEFAKIIGYSDRQIRRWIKGDIQRLDNVDDIACALGVSIGEIFSFGENLPDLLLKGHGLSALLFVY